MGGVNATGAPMVPVTTLPNGRRNGSPVSESEDSNRSGPHPLPYDIDAAETNKFEASRSYLSALTPNGSKASRDSAVLAARRNFVSGILLRLKNAHLIPAQNVDAAFKSGGIGEQIEALVSDTDFDGYFDLDTSAIMKVLGTGDRLATINSLLGLGNTLTNYFADYSNTKVLSYAAEDGFPWEDRLQKFLTRDTAIKRLASYADAPTTRQREEKKTYETARATLEASGFLAAIPTPQDPKNLAKIFQYFATKYPSHKLATDFQLAQEFTQELSAVKTMLFCVAIEEDPTTPREKKVGQKMDLRQVTVTDEQTASPVTLGRLSRNHLGQYRIDCGILTSFDEQVYRAVGADPHIFATFLTGNAVGHSLVAGAFSNTYRETPEGLALSGQSYYFASNNFDTYIITPDRMFGATLSSVGQPLPGAGVIEVGVKKAAAVSLDVSATRIEIVAPSVTSFAHLPEVAAMRGLHFSAKGNLYNALSSLNTLFPKIGIFNSELPPDEIATYYYGKVLQSHARTTSAPSTLSAGNSFDPAKIQYESRKYVENYRQQLADITTKLDDLKVLLDMFSEEEIGFPLEQKITIGGEPVTFRWEDKASAIKGIDNILALCNRMATKMDATLAIMPKE